jgi:hypothetical protein
MILVSSTALQILAVACVVVIGCLYVMRRRVRQGRRVPKF